MSEKLYSEPYVMGRLDRIAELEAEVERLREARDQWMTLTAEAQAEVERLREALREVANSGVEFDDERVGYVTVQIDRPTWNELRALRVDDNSAR